MRPVFGVGTAPSLFKPQPGQPGQRLEFLQKKDVFFSSQSYRAQLANFLNQKPDKPLMFSFARYDYAPLWDAILPAKAQNVILLTPFSTEITEASLFKKPFNALQKHPERKQYSSRSFTQRIPFKNIDATLTQEGFGETQFNTNTEESIKSPQSKNPFGPGNSIFKVQPQKQIETHIQIQEFSGHFVQPQFFLQLDQAFRQAHIKPNTPTWVHQTSDQIHLLPHQNPLQSGFYQVSHPILGMILKNVAKMAAPLLGLNVHETGLELPNGRQIPFIPQAWKDSNGKTANLYQVIGLPNGTWLKLLAPNTEITLPLAESKPLQKIVEQKIQHLEQAGKTRELPPELSLLPMPPLLSKPSFSPLKSPNAFSGSPLASTENLFSSESHESI